MILIIANARRKGGLSGSDNIYEAFRNEWSNNRIVATQEMMDIDFKPFWLCYAYRIFRACWIALTIRIGGIEFVYSASDFLMDSLPALIYKLRGVKWVAGFYLSADWKYTWQDVFFRRISPNRIIYKKTQAFINPIIKKYADVVCVTNESMFDIFKGKKQIAVHGGVDLSKAKQSEHKEYDAVFVGRLHYTKGIEELTLIWDKVIEQKPDAHLAIIGDGDTERELLLNWVADNMNNVSWFKYLGDERFDVYAKSKMVLYTTPPEYSHFSMGPVEAMACGCPMIVFKQDVMRYIRPEATCHRSNIKEYADCIIQFIDLYDDNIDYFNKTWTENAKEWAQTWDWSKRAPSVLKQIREYLK